MCMELNDTGHWIFPYAFNADEWFGFIYRITEISTGREYIGKKQFHSSIRKVVKGRTNRKVVKKESKWKTYTSSSDHINAAIKLNGVENYVFAIESLHKTKGSLSYAEVKAQVFEDVLRAKLVDGTTPKYYNKQIGSVRFIPPTETAEEAKMKVSGYINERYQNKIIMEQSETISNIQSEEHQNKIIMDVVQ